MVGADVSELRKLASQFDAGAATLSQMSGALTNGLQSAHAWHGPAAGRYKSEWMSQHRTALVRASTALRDASRILKQNADEQERASSAHGAVNGGTPAPSARAGQPNVVDSEPWYADVDWNGLNGWSDLAVSVAGSAAFAAQYGASSRWAPRGPDGRFIRPDSFDSRWARGSDLGTMDVRTGKMTNWVPRTDTAAHWARVGKAIDIGGVALGGGLSFMKQWSDDRDAGMGESERVARATTAAVLNAGGSFVGGRVGMYGGAVVGGALGGPVGAVIGGAIGNVVGGYLGGQLGNVIAEHGLIEPIGNAAESASEFVGDAADAVEDTLSDVGDQAKAAVDRFTPW